jgi:hypothetical protein
MLLHLAFFTVNLTGYFPVLLYVCTGFLAVGFVQPPKFHFHEIENKTKTIVAKYTEYNY